jgi:hypothetical protein
VPSFCETSPKCTSTTALKEVSPNLKVRSGNDKTIFALGAAWACPTKSQESSVRKRANCLDAVPIPQGFDDFQLQDGEYVGFFSANAHDNHRCQAIVTGRINDADFHPSSAPASHFSINGHSAAASMDPNKETPTHDDMDVTAAQIFAIGRAHAKRDLCNECGQEHYLSSDGKCYQNSTCGICKLTGHNMDRCFKACNAMECSSQPPHHRDSCKNRQRSQIKLLDQLKVAEENVRALQAFCQGKGISDLPPLKA